MIASTKPFRVVDARGKVRRLKPGVQRLYADTRSQVNGGAWKTVKRVGTRPNGRFAVSVSPSRTTSYRLATPAAAGAAVTVKIP